jgi:hypothetical protein
VSKGKAVGAALLEADAWGLLTMVSQSYDARRLAPLALQRLLKQDHALEDGRQLAIVAYLALEVGQPQACAELLVRRATQQQVELPFAQFGAGGTGSGAAM